MNEEGVGALPNSLKAEALETMFMGAGWRVVKWLLEKQVQAAASQAISAQSEIEVIRAVARMSVYSNVANSIEQQAAVLKK